MTDPKQRTDPRQQPGSGRNDDPNLGEKEAEKAKAEREDDEEEGEEEE
jgi:hypothetical protein